MHRHRDSHGISRSLSECSCDAANEKRACKAGREPETFHDSAELTNFAAAAQQNLRQCRCAEDNAHLPLLPSEGERRPIANRLKIFIDRLMRKWLKVGSSGVKWAIAPRDNGRRFSTRTLLCRRVPAFH